MVTGSETVCACKIEAGQELRLVWEQALEVVVTEGVSLYAENIHDLARLPGKIRWDA